ncbi:MAG TPA: FHA domain-containing protein [Pseudomonadales bacterium]
MNDERTRILADSLILNHAGRDYVVPPDFRGLFAIGRGASCQIVLDSPVVSRLHGCIRIAKDAYAYRDTSSNGTILLTGHDETLIHDREVTLPDAGALKIGDVILAFCRWSG